MNPFDKINVIDYEEALVVLHEGACIKELNRIDDDYFICKQIESLIDLNVIPKMQSLPDKAKELLLKKNCKLHYINQYLIIDNYNVATYFDIDAEYLRNEKFVII